MRLTIEFEAPNKRMEQHIIDGLEEVFHDFGIEYEITTDGDSPVFNQLGQIVMGGQQNITSITNGNLTRR